MVMSSFRYFLRVTIVRRLSDIVVEKDIAVHTLSQFPELNNRWASEGVGRGGMGG